jgi:CubicO group peptidase (beta-lactamase class C family)
MNIYYVYLSLLSSFLLSSCFPLKSIFLGNPDSKDLYRFKHSKINAGEECFEFYKLNRSIGSEVKINDWSSDIPFFKSLDNFSPSHNIRSILIIQNDTVKYTYHNQHILLSDLHPSYSIAKSFTSTLIGIAIDEGNIKSEEELVIKYIPELQNIHHSKDLKIKDLLNHTSGIKYNLWNDAIIYYGDNIFKAIKKIKFENTPGTKQHYLNINTQLLGLILKRATGVSPAKYLEDKIWKPIQMCNDGQWSIDKKNQIEKTFCCIGATAEDYAKFGRLILNNGRWNNKVIISEQWLNKSLSRDTSNGSSFNYNYSWHIGLKEYNDFMAIGLYKQHIYVNRNKKLIIVLFNDRENKLIAERLNWWDIFRQIADQL